MFKICPEINSTSRNLTPVFIIFFIGALSMILLSGCATFNGTRFEHVLGSRQNLIKLGHDIAEDLERQAYPPLTPMHPDQPILMTTYVNNNNLNETSHFSMVLQEHITSRFVQMGYTVREIKLGKSLQINPTLGEKILSRQLKDIEPSQQAQAISVGTYSLTNSRIYLSARLVNPENGNIISSSDYVMNLNDERMAMLGVRHQATATMDPVDEPPQSILNKLLYW